MIGLCRQYNASELASMIKLQNNGIKALLESNVSEEDTKFDVVSVNALKSNPTVFKATIRVSNVIRSVIAKQGDRLFVGAQAVCKVWDSYYVSRCYKCQEYGHQSKQCSNNPACGHCAGGHETRDCTKHTNSRPCCINCKRANKSPLEHAANSFHCPVLVEQQDKVKSTIPFYQRQR